jgi:hypothetical protein
MHKRDKRCIKNLAGKSEGRLRCRCENNIKMDVKKEVQLMIGSNVELCGHGNESVGST